MLRRTASLALMLVLAACSSAPTGPGPTDPTGPGSTDPTGPGSTDPTGPDSTQTDTSDAPAAVGRVEITGTDEGTDSLTLHALGDTVRIHVAIYDAEGNELDLSGRDVEWTSSDSSTINVNERGAFLIPEQTWLNVQNGNVIFLDGAPESPGPQSATLTVTVDGVEASREFVQTSPAWAVDVSPDGSCILAPGSYKCPYDDYVVVVDSPKVKTATVEARDYWGRVEPLTASDIDWASSDPAVATVEPDPDVEQGALISIHTAGFVDIRGTVNGISDVYGIESSDQMDWNSPEEHAAGKGHGSVSCTTGPGT